MCGRYTQTKNEAMLRKRFRFDPPGFDVVPRYNIAPTQEAPVLVGRTLKLLRWGFEGGLFNARAETAAVKPTFRDAFRRGRCLVPADGFYEWRKEGSRRVPLRFVLKSREPFAFAGLHEGGAFTILTTAPNPLVATVHDRMPLILREELEEAWLDPAADVREALLPFPAERMEAYVVSAAVGSPRNDDASLVEPAAPPPPPAQLSLF